MKKKFITGLATGLFLFGMVGVSSADSKAVNYSSWEGFNYSSSWVLGWEFIANANTAVTELGVFDFNQDGFAQAQIVGLWSNDGSLLASTFVNNSNVLEGVFRFNDIVDVVLTAGEKYRVGSAGGEGYVWGINDAVFASEITYLQDRWHWNGDGNSNATLVFPEETSFLTDTNNSGIYGANFKIDAPPVPEPVTMVLFGTGIVGLAATRRRKKQA